MEMTLDALVRDYPQIGTCRWLYYSNYYDGPIEGMIETPDGSLLYASLVDETDEGERTYSLMLLDDESASYEAEKESDFVKYVGDYWTFTPESRNMYKPQSEWNKFYIKWPWKDRKPLTGKIVGWIRS